MERHSPARKLPPAEAPADSVASLAWRAFAAGLQVSLSAGDGTPTNLHKGGTHMRKALPACWPVLSMTVCGRHFDSRRSAEELTIFWAEGIRRTTCRNSSTSMRRNGTKITVETTPWAISRPKPSPIQRQGRCLRHGRRRGSQWLGAGLTGWSLCRPDRLLQAAQSRAGHGPGDGEVLLDIPATAASTGRSLEGDARRWSYRKAGSRTEGGWKLQGQVWLRPRVPKDVQGAARHRRVLHRPDLAEVWRRDLHRQFL